MIAAISQRRDLNKHGVPMDNLESAYIEYFSRFGLTLIQIPNIPSLAEGYFSKLNIDMIILTGGNDVVPSSYGSDRKSDTASKERDETEAQLLKIAVRKNIPVLGICRGMQFINVFFKGRLEDVADVSKGHIPGKDHDVIIDHFGNTKVNSFHNHCITKKSLSKELNSFAVSGDIIEGIYHPKFPIAGIEWHPERKSPDNDVNEKIVKAFIGRELFWKR